LCAFQKPFRDKITKRYQAQKKANSEAPLARERAKNNNKKTYHQHSIAVIIVASLFFRRFLSLEKRKKSSKSLFLFSSVF
jgi:hypothetical protein